MPYLHSSALDDPLLFERMEGFRGADGYERGVQLPPDLCQQLTNALVTDKLELMTRPGVAALGDEAAGANAVQGVFYFDTAAPLEYVLKCVNQTFYKWDGSNWTDAAAANNAWAASGARLAGAQLIDKLYITDGTNNWRSWDGTTWVDLGSTAGTATSDPPVGATIACVHAGRVFAAGKGTADDTLWASFLLAGSPSGAPSYVAPGTGKWDHVNFSIRVGTGAGDPIKGLVGLRDSWLCVLKESSIWLLDTDPTASYSTAWSAVQLSTGIGCVGKRAVATVGNDVHFMARDGVRSIARMQGTSDQYEVSAPLSRPMQEYIERINPSALSKVAAIRFRHLVLWALPLDSATEPNTVIVWNERTQAWMGAWTGWTPTEFVVSRFSGVDALCFGDTTGRVNKWLVDEDEEDTDTFTDNGTDISSTFRLKAWNFGEPVNDKDGYYLEVRFVETANMIEVKVYYDEAEDRQFSASAATTTVTLPVVLPFVLPTSKPITVRKSLNDLGPFNEMFLEVCASAGKIKLKNATAAAFLNTLQNE